MNFLANKNAHHRSVFDDGRLYCYDCCMRVYIVCISPPSPFSPLFIGSMIEIVSRIDIVADGEYDIFSPLFIGSMIEIISRIDIVADGEYSDSMVTDV